MPLPTLPTPPSRDDPANFSARADAFLAALPAFGEAANSLEQSLQMVATTGTSTTSLAIGTGSKTLTTQAGKAWVVGAFVYIASSASVANLMFGQITDYNSTTGSLTVNVLSYTGSGTLAAWSIGLSAPRGDTETFSGTLYANSFVMNAAASVFWRYDAPGGKVILNFDANDFLSYDRGVDAFAFMVGGANRLYIDQYGPGRNDDASTANGLVRKSQLDSATAQATETARGTLEIATAAEAAAGTDDVRAVTPAKVRSALNASGTAPVYGCRAWGSFNGTNGTLLSGGNLTASRTGTGFYVFTFTTPMPHANYSLQCSFGTSGSPTASTAPAYSYGLKTASGFSIQVSNNDSDVVVDPALVDVAVFC